jgi:type 1 glutamine amidotransferase/Ca2+-binding EF-hand superfamily protein
MAYKAALLFLIIATSLYGQPGRGGGRGRGGMAQPVFTALDTDKDGAVTKNEMKSTFDGWFATWDTAKTGSLTEDQLLNGLLTVFPAPAPGGFNVWGNSQPMVARQVDIAAMMAALPTTPGAHPARPRKVLVFGHTGAFGFVHASIPLAAKTVDALGNQGNLWSTTVSYNLADITAANLKQYDAIFLDSTTGCFLDDADPVATKARRAAFLDFVRSGKGVAGIHAATDSYHWDCAEQSKTAAATPRNDAAHVLATQILSQGDKNGDRKISREELAALADSWYDKLDTDKSGKIPQADFQTRFATAVPPPQPAKQPDGASTLRQWPEFNTLIGGFFKFHWSDPQLISVKIDDPKSPLTAMFHGEEFDIHDETYTFAQDSFSRTNVHVLTSIDYAKMSDADKAKEKDPRTDQDYALSYIHKEGKGRVFYEGHGHNERVYANTPMLEHIRAGIQYALGDLKADDSPSKK